MYLGSGKGFLYVREAAAVSVSLQDVLDSGDALRCYGAMLCCISASPEPAGRGSVERSVCCGGVLVHSTKVV